MNGMIRAVTGWYFTNKKAFSSWTRKFYFVRKTKVWDTKHQTHNPEVIGSNPILATKQWTGWQNVNAIHTFPGNVNFLLQV